MDAEAIRMAWRAGCWCARRGRAFGCGGRRGKGEALPPASGQEEGERSDVRRMACLRGAGTRGGSASMMSGSGA